MSAPLIMLQPTNQTVTPGSTVILRAGVIGNLPLDYQWQASGTNLLDAGNLSGSTTDTLTLTNVTEANNGTYTLVATNSLGRTNSAGAILSVVPVSAVGTKLSTLYSFTGGTDGSSPNGLADGRDGYLYGTTQLGGSFHNGSAFKIGTNGGFIMLVSFDQTNGAFPLAGLVLSTNRNFYGTTSAGGASGAGTVLAMTPAGEASILHEFTGGNDGGSPATALIQGTDGGFYGATQNGGANGLGTIFRITSGGTLGTLHAFVGGAEASSPAGALLELSHGTFYGTSASGGTSNQGSVFRLIPGGALTTLYSFTGGMDGYHPVGSLVLGDDGALYGATSYNTIRGFAFYGTLFNLSTNGALQTLYALNFTDGSYPAAGLVLSSDGNFYGTTEQGGAADYGTVFRMTPGGVVSTLVEFDGFNDGANPVTALTEGSDGNLYGTTSAGGPGGHGTIFRLSFSGAPQITAQPVGQTGLTGGSAVFSVAVTGGAPLSYQWQRSATNLTDHASLRGASTRILRLANLTLADAGSYSVIVTNASGSVASSGAVLSVEVSPPSFQIVSQSGGNLNLSWSTAPGHTYQLQSKTSLATANWISLNGSITAAGESLETSTPMSSNSQRFYRVILLP